MNHKSLRITLIIYSILVFTLIIVNINVQSKNEKLNDENTQLVKKCQELSDKYYGWMIQDNLMSAKIFIMNRESPYAQRCINVAQLYLDHHYEKGILKDSINHEINLVRVKLALSK